MVKFTDLISKGENNQRYVKYVFWKVFKSSKIINESISCNAADVFYSKSTQKKIGHSKGTWVLEHSRHLGIWVLEHLRHSGTQRVLGNSGTQRELGHSGTQGTWILGHSDNWTLGHSKGTWALRYSGARALETLEALYLADSAKTKLNELLNTL